MGWLHWELEHLGVTPANQTKKSQFMNFSRGHSGTKVRCESHLFSQGKTPEFTKVGEIHELFVLALSLVWFAGATPETSACGVERLGVMGITLTTLGPVLLACLN